MSKNIRIFSLCVFLSTFIYASDKNFAISEHKNKSSIIRFNLNELKVQEVNDGFSKIGLDIEPKIIEEGKPELPVYSFSYGLNPEKEYNIEYKVIRSSIISDINIYPHQPEKKDEYQEFIRDDDIYEGLKPYPESNIYQTTISMRGYEIMNIQILPFEYLPETKKLVVHDEVEMERALRLNARLIGVNNRNLKEMTTDLSVSERIATNFPGVPLVSESGIRKADDILRLRKSKFSQFLIGESLMKETNRENYVQTLVNSVDD